MHDDNPSDDYYSAGDRFFGQMIDAGVADKQFIKDIVEMFISEGKQSLACLEIAVNQNHSSDIYLYAHKLKSSFLMFDMYDAHKLAVELEESTPENQEVSKGLIASLKNKCDESFARLTTKYLSH